MKKMKHEKMKKIKTKMKKKGKTKEKKQREKQKRKKKKGKKTRKIEKWKKSKRKTKKGQMKRNQKIRNLLSFSRVFVFTRKILDELHGLPLWLYFFRRHPRRFPCFFGMCLFPLENQQSILGRQRFFRRKATISFGRDTKTHILTTKINEQLAQVSPSNNNYSFRIMNHLAAAATTAAKEEKNKEEQIRRTQNIKKMKN